MWHMYSNNENYKLLKVQLFSHYLKIMNSHVEVCRFTYFADSIPVTGSASQMDLILRTCSSYLSSDYYAEFGETEIIGR